MNGAKPWCSSIASVAAPSPQGSLTSAVQPGKYTIRSPPFRLISWAIELKSTFSKSASFLLESIPIDHSSAFLTTAFLRALLLNPGKTLPIPTVLPVSATIRSFRGKWLCSLLTCFAICISNGILTPEGHSVMHVPHWIQ